MTKKPTDIAWSHSALKRYEDCPHMYYHEKVIKTVPFVESEALIKGRDMHAALEFAVKGEKPLPARWSHLQGVVDWAGELPDKRAEEELAFTSSLMRCKWFDRQHTVWARIKIDLQAFFSPEVGLAVDYKSGKDWGDDGQAAITALGMFWANPELQSVQTVWYYVEQDKQTLNSYSRDQLPDLMDRPLKTLAQISKSYNTEHWPKTPGRACRFCGVVSCEHRGKSQY